MKVQKIMALCLVLCMVLAMLPATALAVAYPAIYLDTPTEVTFEEEWESEKIFKFQPTESGLYTFSSSGADVDVYGGIQTQNWSWLGEYYGSEDNGEFSVTVAMTANKTYYLKTSPENWEDGGSYMVNIQMADLTVLTPGSSGAVNMDKYNVPDYFSFTPAQSGLYAFCVEDDTGGYVSLYDSQWNMLAEGTNIHRALTAGETYYYAAGNYWGDATSYTYTFEQVETTPLVLETPTYATAEEAHGYTYFSFTPELTGKYYFYSVGTEADPWATLFDSDWNEINWSDDSYEDYHNFYMSQRLIAGQTYYLRVSYYNIGAYMVMLSDDSTPDYHTIWLDEPAHAEIAPAGEKAYFVFKPETTTIYYFYSFTNLDTKGYIYDVNMNLLAENDNSTDETDFRVSYTLEAGQTYFLAAELADSTLTEDFTVMLTMDPQRSPADCEALILDMPYDAVITEQNGADYFVFTPETTGNYYFYSVGSYDCYAGLYESDWNELTWADDGGEWLNFYLSYRLIAGHTYYFCVGNHDPATFTVVLTKDTKMDYHTIWENEYFAAPIHNPDEDAYFVFTPDTTTTYYYLSYGPYDTVGAIYDRNMNLLVENNNGEDGSNFYMSYTLEAGQKYYLSAGLLGGGLGTFPVMLTMEPTRTSADLETLVLDVPSGANIVPGCGADYFSFTPAVTGTYFFYSVSEDDTYGFLFDSDLNILAEADYCHNGDADFCIEYTLIAGKTYYYAADYWGNRELGAQGIFTVIVSMNDEASEEQHSHNYFQTVTAPTCTTQGYTTYTCQNCRYTYMDSFVAATGHNWETVVTAPTCTEKGYTTYTCANCDYSYVGDYTQHTGHGYHAVVTDPTCTEGGYTTYTCADCGDSYIDNHTEPAGHSYQTIVTDPTCDASGYTTHQCLICGHSYVDGHVGASGHSYQAVATSATCTTAGYTTYTCTICGDSYTDNAVAALGHIWWDATCTAAKTCSVCGISEGSAMGHSYTATVIVPTCTERGCTTYTCSVCDDSYTDAYTDARGHVYEYAVTAVPTTSVAGVLTGTCVACDAVDTVVLPALNVTDYIATVEKQPTYTETGIACYTWHSETCGTFRFETVIDMLVLDCNVLLQIGTVTGNPGDTVEVIFSLQNAPLLRAIGISGITFDSEHLTLVSGEWLLADGELSHWNAEDMTAGIAFKFGTNCNGDIFKLTFQIHEDAPEAEYAIGCDLILKEKSTGLELEIPVEVVSGTISVCNYLAGDVNGDGLVDTDDAIHLLYHTLFGDGMYAVNQNCDFNNDGVVDTDDAIYLLYYTLFGDAMYPLN